MVSNNIHPLDKFFQTCASCRKRLFWLGDCATNKIEHGPCGADPFPQA